jgi:amino acid transporter
VFDQINGLPVHALVLHAAVIFVPLLALGAIVYALVPRWRPKIGWAVALLAVIAPVSALVAMLSGEKLYDRLIAQGLSGPGKDILDDHMGYGGLTWWFSLALGVVSLIMFALTRRETSPAPKIVQLILSVAMIALAVLAGFYVFKTGDSGATAVWGTY